MPDLFPSITAEHWRAAFKRARTARNEIAEKIKHMITGDWIKTSTRRPTKADFPAWVYWDDGGVYICASLEAFSGTYWKRADIPAPPKELTQAETDRTECKAACKRIGFVPLIQFGEGWSAALAYERAEVARLLAPIQTPFLDMHTCKIIEAIFARCGGGK